MKLYAERRSRLGWQIVGDLVTAVWIVAWIWLGLRLHDLLDALGKPAQRVSDASTSLADSLGGTGDQIRNLQFVGDVLAAPFDAIISSARELATAGANGQQTLARIADLSVPLVAVFPVVFAVVVWLALRGRWIRQATAAVQLRARDGGDTLLAAHALSSSRLDRLAGADLADDPLSDEYSRRRLAAHTLRQLGLRTAPP